MLVIHLDDIHSPIESRPFYAIVEYIHLLIPGRPILANSIPDMR